MKIKTPGFTLVEVLIAMSLFAVVVMEVILAYSIDKYAATMSKHRTIASNLVRSELETALAEDYDSLVAHSLTVTVNDGMRDVPMTKTLKISDMTGYKMLYSKVTWSERAAAVHTLKEEAVTYVAEE